MIEIFKAGNEYLGKILEARYLAIRAISGLEEDYVFPREFQRRTKKFFEETEQTTVLALEKEKIIGCATICYIRSMPTIDHPTGKRAKIMNVYTKEDYQGCGIASQMMLLLLEEAKKKRITEISLEAKGSVKYFYQKCGFELSDDRMVLKIVRGKKKSENSSAT